VTPTDLRGFLRAVEAAGELRRVRVPVDPRLEITEICQRVVREEGPALLFENVTGSDFPLLINAFGSRRRLEIALGAPPAAVGESFVGLARDLMPPSLGKLVSRFGDLRRIRGMKPRLRTGGPVREVSEEPDLERLPVLTCWPDDGGPFFTFPLVHTRSPRDGTGNVGIYRMQRFGPAETGMHWQIGKGGGYHHYEAEEEGRELEVAVAFGGDPLLMLAAMMPLPESLSEIAFVGLVRGKSVEMSRGVTVDVDVPAASEFVLEGTVAAGERRVEGPFGDHFGHYSAEAPFPVFRVKRTFRRRDALYPAIVVGKPPQEDGFMGNAVQELLGPLIQLPHPEVRDLWSYEETGFHHLLVASVEERFAKEAMRSAMGLLGQGQLGLTKVLWMVGRDVNPRSLDEVLEAIADHFDPAEDFHLLTKVPFDTLDFTSTTLNLGSRMILDATPSGRPPSARPEIPDLTTVDRRVRGQATLGPSLLAVRVDSDDVPAVLREILRVLPGARAAEPGAGSPAGDDGPPPNPKLVVAVSPDIPLDDPVLLMWGIFTRFDPARDAFFEESRLRGAWPVHRGRLAIDATFKPGYPAALEMDPEIVNLVDRRWTEYGITP
jgi:4-hydroxy-3-polyprenylbenzoate decarboxylase